MNMNSLEKQAVQELNTDLIRDLDPIDVGPYLYEKNCLSKEQLSELYHRDRIPRTETCQKFLLYIVDKCSFQTFIDALRNENAYSFLAHSLEKKLKSLKEEHVTQRQEKEKLFVSVGKISVHNGCRKQLAVLAHKLKKLSHDGNVDVFRRITKHIHKRCCMHNFRHKMKTTDAMKQADMRFIVLDAEVEARRLKYDVTLYESDVFHSMKELIPYTTNPRVSSMTFLARYGSSLTMMESIDTGLEFLDFAKQHAEQVQPCKETGMVFYIEINLLLQKYEKKPEYDLKKDILQRTDLAISHFNEDEFGLDYHRMLMLKKVFCHLGIGLFGERIPHAIVDDQDVRSAGNCLDFVEKPEVWKGIEVRRKMFFLIAKSEWNRRLDKYDMAKIFAKEAKKLAQQNEWSIEAANIVHLLEDIDSTDAKQIYLSDDVECIETCVDNIFASNDDDEYDEKDYLLHMNDKALCVTDRVYKGYSFSDLNNGSFGVVESSANNHFHPQILTTTGISQIPVSLSNVDSGRLNDDDDDKLYMTEEKEDTVVDKAMLKNVVKAQCLRDRVRTGDSFSDLKNGSFGVVERSADNRFDPQTLTTSGISERLVSVSNVDLDILDDDDDYDDDQLDLTDEKVDTVVHEELFVNVVKAPCVTDKVHKGYNFSDLKNGIFGLVERSVDTRFDPQTIATPGISERLISASNVDSDRLDDDDGKLDLIEENEDTVVDQATLENVVDLRKLKSDMNMKFNIHKNAISDTPNKLTMSTGGVNLRNTSTFVKKKGKIIPQPNISKNDAKIITKSGIKGLAMRQKGYGNRNSSAKIAIVGHDGYEPKQKKRKLTECN